MDATTRARLKQALETRRAELTGLSESSASGRDPVALDQQSVGRVSRVDALQQQAMAQAQDRQRRQELMRIEQALLRMADGDYGYCTDCGEAIAPKRLEIDPSVALCINCAGRG